MPFHVVKIKKGFKVQDDKGNYYSKKLLTKKNAIAQQRALYASEAREQHFSGAGFASWLDDDGHHIILQGNGFFSDLFTKVRNIGTNIIGSITAAPLSSASNVISQGIREDYPPKVRQILEQYGDANVIKLTLIREPIKRFIDYALNVISMGRWGEAKKRLNYDKLFHLYMIATLQLPNGDKGYLKIEKNEVINITTDLGTRAEGAEYMEVPVPCCLTVVDMMNKTRQMVGAPMFRYEAFNNNCQVFLLNILKANELATPQVAGFINQGVDSLLQELPNYVRPFANLTTNIAGLANRVIYGRGEEPPPLIDTSARVDHSTTLTAQQINELIERLQFPDDMTDDEQYNTIGEVMDFLLSDPQYLQNEYDNFEISNARGTLNESRESKPYEFVNVIEKILEGLEPNILEGAGLNADGSWTGTYDEWVDAGFPGCGPGMMSDPENEGACIPIAVGQQKQQDLDKYSNLAAVSTANQDDDAMTRNLAIQVRKQQEEDAKKADFNNADTIKQLQENWNRTAIDKNMEPEAEQFDANKHTSLEYLNSVEGRHKRELDPLLEQLYQSKMASVSGTDKQRFADIYNKSERERYGDNEEIYSPESGFTLTDTHGNVRRVNKVRLRNDGGYDIQYSTGAWEYQPGANDWDCNAYQKGDSVYDRNACSVDERQKAANMNAQDYRDKRDREYDNLSGWDKFVNGLSTVGRYTQDYIAPVVSTALNFVPGMGAVSTAIDVANEIGKQFTGDECRDFSECTDRNAEQMKANSLYHQTKGDRIATNYLTDSNWQRLLGQNEKAHGLVSDTMQYGSRAGKYYETGAGLTGGGRFKDELAEMGDAFKLMYNYVTRPFSEEGPYAEFLQAFYSTYHDALDEINDNSYNRPAKQQVLNRFKNTNIRKLIELMADVGKEEIYHLYGADLAGIPTSIRGDIRAGIDAIDQLMELQQQHAIANAPPPPTLNESIGADPSVQVAFQSNDDPSTMYLTGQGSASSRVAPFTEEEAEMFEYMRRQPGFNSLSRAQKIRVVKEMVYHEKRIAEMDAREEANPSLLVITGPTGEVSIAEKVMGSGEKIQINSLFKRQLKQVGIKPHKYLDVVREVAEDAGYDPSMLYFSDDGNHKLMMLNPDGKKTHFGAVEYNDFIIWSHLEELGKVNKGYAEQKRRVFTKSHCKIKGDWKKDKYSANELALKILWGDAQCS